MSKSVLVIDTPQKCRECPLHASDFVAVYCNAVIEDKGWCHPPKTICRNHEYDVPIPTWCPLLPLPERKNLEDIVKEGLPLQYEYAQGYNDCLQDIQKGNKND